MFKEALYQQLKEYESSGFLSVTSANVSDGEVKLAISAADKVLEIKQSLNEERIEITSGSKAVILQNEAQSQAIRVMCYLISSGIYDGTAEVIKPEGLTDNGDLVFSDFNNRRWVVSSANEPNITFALYDLMRLKKQGYTLLKMPTLAPMKGDNVKVLNSIQFKAPEASKVVSAYSLIKSTVDRPLFASSVYADVATCLSSVDMSVNGVSQAVDSKIWSKLLGVLGLTEEKKTSEVEFKDALLSARAVSFRKIGKIYQALVYTNGTIESLESCYQFDGDLACLSSALHQVGVDITSVNAGSVNVMARDYGFSEYKGFVEAVCNSADWRKLKVVNDKSAVKSSVFKFSEEKGKWLASSQASKLKDSYYSLYDYILTLDF